MGTRGSFGVYSEGNTKVSYNHSDSYPDCLGDEIVTDIKRILKDHGLARFREKAAELFLVNEDSKPTPANKERLAKFTDLGVSSGDSDDWYCVLRGLQGELYNTLDVGVMIDGEGFLGDSLFCEYAYIANVDDEVLEIYQGFQQTAPVLGRYKEKTDGNEYYPVELKLTISFEEIEKESNEHLVKRMKQATGEDSE